MHRRAFTLVELLVVVAIVGVAAAIVGPRVGPMLAGGRLRVAARELAGAGRYARTMALLNGVPVELSVDLDGGSFAVKAAERDASERLGLSDLAAVTNDVGYTEELLRTSARRQVSFSGGFGLAVSHDDAERGAATNAWERYGSRGDGGEDGGEDGAAVLSDVVSRGDSVNVERKLDGVRVRFGGWRDVAMSRRRDDRTGESDSGTAAVRYRSNGTVRPHRWIVENADDPEDRIEITVNAVGRATVEAAKR